MRDGLIKIIAGSIARTDARLIAFALMTNHFHLLIWQGAMTLGQVMQPINRRLALLLKRELGRSGRLLERRFYDVQCVDADHLREAIVYTHLNPVKAGMCERAVDYRWSSRLAYAGEALPFAIPRLAVELDLFAHGPDRSRSELHQDYLAYENWREACRRTPEDELKPPKPSVRGGDEYWQNSVGARGVCALEASRPTTDLRDVVRRTVMQIAPDMPMDVVCSGNRGRQYAAVRRAAVASATRAGYSVAKIARHMRISESLVSRVACEVDGRPPVLFR
jgi:REP element-mobilizing transposase RayT